MADEVSQHYGDLLDGSYDCVDRIVLNGYFRLCYSGGGFREWWRRLMGSEEKLDNAPPDAYGRSFQSAGAWLR